MPGYPTTAETEHCNCRIKDTNILSGFISRYRAPAESDCDRCRDCDVNCPVRHMRRAETGGLDKQTLFIGGHIWEMRRQDINACKQLILDKTKLGYEPVLRMQSACKCSHCVSMIIELLKAFHTADQNNLKTKVSKHWMVCELPVRLNWMSLICFSVEKGVWSEAHFCSLESKCV